MTIDVLTDDLSLLESIYQFEDATIQMYGNLASSRFNSMTSNDSNIVTEGVSDMVKSMGSAIRKLIAAIKDFFVGFIRAFTSYTLNLQDFVKQYKDDLLAKDHDFEIIGYKFTVMDSKDPDMSDFNKLVSTYNSSLSTLKDIKKTDIIAEGNSFLDEKNLGEMRARVLGVSGGIAKDDFVEVVRKQYRDGETETSSIHIGNDEIRDIVTNADRMVTLKKKAEKDRDAIIQLLSKAEVFFNRKAGMIYRDAKSKVDAKTFDVDDDYKVSHTPADIPYTDSDLSKVTTLLSVKYNETKAISSIINVVISERANAFRDLVKQSRKVVGKAMQSKKKGTGSDDVKECINYSDLGEQVSYALHESDIAACKAEISREFQFLMESIESGEIRNDVMEAGIRDAGKKVKEAVATVIQNIMNAYRRKAIGQIKEYSPWYTNQDVIENCTSNAEKKNLSLMPLWDGVYGTTAMGQIQTLFKAAVQKTNDPNKCNWCSPFVTAKNLDELKDISDMNNRLKNYFRCGKKDVAELKPEDVTGKKLGGIVGGMFDYLSNYDTISSGSDRLKSSARSLVPPVEESFDASTYIGFLGKPICETDFFVFEAPNGIGGNAGLGDGAKAAAATRAQAPNQTAQNAGKEASQSATTVVDNTKKDAEVATGTGKKDVGNTSMADYYKTSIGFCEKVALAYVTTLEERFLLYYRTCDACASDEYKAKAFLKKSGEGNQSVAKPKENK